MRAGARWRARGRRALPSSSTAARRRRRGESRDAVRARRGACATAGGGEAHFVGEVDFGTGVHEHKYAIGVTLERCEMQCRTFALHRVRVDDARARARNAAAKRQGKGEGGIGRRRWRPGGRVRGGRARWRCGGRKGKGTHEGRQPGASSQLQSKREVCHYERVTVAPRRAWRGLRYAATLCEASRTFLFCELMFAPSASSRFSLRLSPLEAASRRFASI